jgi:DNA-binding transcriptional LysR family regulator
MPEKPSLRYKELNLAQLRAFAACVQSASFSAAARVLNMSQPAVWQQVRALERSVGAELLRKRGRALALTEDGELFLELTSSVLGNVDSLQRAFAERRRQAPRSLVVIGSPGVITEELARPVSAFCRRHPQVRLRLLSRAGPGTLDLLVSGEADLAVLPLGSEVADQAPYIVTEPLCRRPWVAAIPKSHPLCRKRQLTPADLARYPLILPEQDSNWRRRVDDVFRAAGVLDQLRVVLEASTTLAARRYVSLGVGIALLAEPRESWQVPRVVSRSLDHLLSAEEIVLVWRRGAKSRPEALRFADFLKSSLSR